MPDPTLPPGVRSQQCRCGGDYFVARGRKGAEVWVDPVVQSAGNLVVTVTAGTVTVAEVSRPQADLLRSAGMLVYARHGGGTTSSSCQKKATR